MTARSPDASADAVDLEALLVLLHGADAPVGAVEVIYRLWRHRELAAAFDQPIPNETFRFEPPAGEQIQSRWGEERVEHVTLVEAQQLAPAIQLAARR